MQQLNRQMVRGDTFVLPLSYWPNGTKYIFRDGVDTVVFKLWDPVTGETLIQKDAEFVEGSIRVTLLPAETIVFETYGLCKTYKYELRWTKQDGSVETLIHNSDLVVWHSAKEKTNG